MTEEQIIRDIKFLLKRIHENESDSFKRRKKYPLKAFIKSQEPCDPDNDHICDNDCSTDHCCQYVSAALMSGVLKYRCGIIIPVSSNCRYAYCPFCGISWGSSPDPGYLNDE